MQVNYHSRNCNVWGSYTPSKDKYFYFYLLCHFLFLYFLPQRRKVLSSLKFSVPWLRQDAYRRQEIRIPTMTIWTSLWIWAKLAFDDLHPSSFAFHLSFSVDDFSSDEFNSYLKLIFILPCIDFSFHCVFRKFTLSSYWIYL